MAKILWGLAILAMTLNAGPGIMAPVDVAKIDVSRSKSALPHGSGYNLSSCYMDSSFNQYGFWTSMQDPVKAEDSDIISLLVRRIGDGTVGSGALGLIWSVDGGFTWNVDWPVNDGILNDPHPGDYYGRYPTGGIHPDFPYGSWPELLSGGSAWGYAGVGNEPDWGTTGFYGVFSSNIDVHKNWSWARDDGMIVGCAQSESDNNYSWVYDPALGDWDTPPASQSQIAGFSTYAHDYRNGQFLLAGFHSSLGGLAYATSSDGVYWNSPVLVSPPGMPSFWSVYWIDGAFLPNDNPVMIVADLDLTASLDQANEVWFVRPDTAIRVDAGMDYYNHYAQLALNSSTGEIWVWWAEATHQNIDPTIDGWWHDIYYRVSMDGGYSWSAPTNYTMTNTINEVMPQIGRYGNALLYATTLDDTQGDLYYGVLTAGDFDAYNTRFFVDNGELFVGTEEETARETARELGLSVVNHMSERELAVNFTLTKEADVTFSMFNTAGRCLWSNCVSYTAGEHQEVFSTRGLSAGTYILRLSAGDRVANTKFVILR